ncbi:MAG: hypothetical protein C5B51_26005 [Terriglobia bacterium]|nr:MAG: hypothetical protein C5B51_26005 [Terriglobia bacterium]
MNQTSNSRAVILVVDDEAVVLSTVCSILEYSGFEVLQADSPEAAFSIAGNERRVIDLLLCDVVMPGMNGPELADRFRLLHPETGVLFMAGLPDTPEIAQRILSRGLAFLPKPFLPATLAEKVRQVLSRGPDKASAATA